MPKYLESRFSKTPGDPSISTAWWAESDARRHKSVRSLLEALRHEQTSRDFSNRLYYSMYMGRTALGIDGDMYARHAIGMGMLHINVSRTTAAAANSKIAKNKVRVLFLTEDGNFEEQWRGKRLTKLVNGTFYASGFYEAQALAQLGSCTWDIGAVYFYRDGKKVMCETVPGVELRVDAWDGRYGKPSMLFRDMVVPRRALLGDPAYAASDLQDTIRRAKRSSRGTAGPHGWIADSVEVTHAWHLRSSEDADDGCHTVTLENGTLLHEEWRRDYFPFVFHRWEPNLLGFYGQSIIAQLVGIQQNVTKVGQDIQDHCDLSTGFVAIPADSDVSKAAWTNEVWRKITFSGPTAPQLVAPPAFQQEKLDWIQWLIARAPQEVGLSELSVTSRKPAGLNSGQALRDYNDIESERFQMVQQRYEQSFVDAALIITDFYEDAYAELGNFELSTPGHKLVETIDWEAAKLDRENYTVRPVPTSFLPSTPAAKLDTIQEMLQAGMLSRDEAMILLDYPDLDRVNSLRNAPRLNIERRIEDMLNPTTPKASIPEPFWDLQLALKITQSAYNDAEQAGAPERNLTLLQNFMAQCQKRIDEQTAQAQAAAAPAQPQGMPDAGAPASPGMPPTPAP